MAIAFATDLNVTLRSLPWPAPSFPKTEYLLLPFLVFAELYSMYSGSTMLFSVYTNFGKFLSHKQVFLGTGLRGFCFLYPYRDLQSPGMDTKYHY